MTRRPPLVSVVLIFYQARRFLAAAVESVRAQTTGDWELILVDDGSTDGSSAIAMRLHEEDPGRIRVLEHRDHRNLGMSAARNLGIAAARGEFIALLDSDDVWETTKLERQLLAMGACPGAGMVCNASLYWHSWSGALGAKAWDTLVPVGVPEARLFEPPDLTLLLHPLGRGEPPCVSSLLFRTHALRGIGGFEESFRGELQLYEDQALLSKAYLSMPIIVLDDCLDRYRIHPGSFVARTDRKRGEIEVRRHFLAWYGAYLERIGAARPALLGVLRDARANLTPGLPIMSRTPRVRASNVTRPEPDGRLWGAALDQPERTSWSRADRVRIAGWVLPRNGAVGSIAVRVFDRPVHEGTTGANRPDVANTFPAVSGAQSAGFDFELDLRGVGAAPVTVAARLDDRSEVSIGSFRLTSLPHWPGRRRRRRSELEPVSDVAGFDRGQPIDRFLIERFLSSHALAIRGDVLEIGDDLYTRRFGTRVDRSDVLHVDSSNPKATIVADLNRAGELPSERFDCVIFTQTLQLVFELRHAMSALHRILRPGGTLLLTAPGISPIYGDEWKSTWFWSFTALSLERLLAENFEPGDVEVRSHGNVRSASAFLHGLGADDAGTKALRFDDPLYPLLLCARAVKRQELLEVALPPSLPGLIGASIDRPKHGGLGFDDRVMRIEGWVVGDAQPVVAVEGSVEGEVVARTEPVVPRPDVRDALALERALRSGFAFDFAALGGGRTELNIEAVLDDGSRAPFGLIAWRAAARPPISVVIPCFDQAEYLGRAIESASEQHPAPRDVIVVDDGSSDNTQAVTERFAHVRYYRTPRRGPAAARNEGLYRAAGEYVLFLDADDALLPGALFNLARTLDRRPDAGLAFGGFRVVHGSSVRVEMPEETDPGAQAYERLLELKLVGMHGATLYRRGVFDRLGGFDENLRWAEDLEFQLRVARDFPLVGVAEAIADYRIHGANASWAPGRMLEGLWRVLDLQEPWIRHDERLRAARQRGRQRILDTWGKRYVESISEQCLNQASAVRWLDLAQHAIRNPRLALGLVSLALRRSSSSGAPASLDAAQAAAQSLGKLR